MINVIRKKGINPMTKAVLHWIQWTRVSTVVETALAKKMARGGTYSVGEASGVMLDFPQFIIDELLNGNAVRVAGLGEFKLKVSAKADADPEKVSTRGAQVSILFEADKELASRLQNEAEFKIVTTPTPEGQSDADSAVTPSEGEGTGEGSGSGEGQGEGSGEGQGGNDLHPTSEDEFTLAATTGTGVESVEGAGTVQRGEQATLTATVTEGYTFDGWYDGETKVSGDNPYTLTMPASNLSLEARATQNGSGGDDGNGNLEG